jgi:hypothetical protein
MSAQAAATLTLAQFIMYAPGEGLAAFLLKISEMNPR